MEYVFMFLQIYPNRVNKIPPNPIDNIYEIINKIYPVC